MTSKLSESTCVHTLGYLCGYTLVLELTNHVLLPHWWRPPPWPMEQSSVSLSVCHSFKAASLLRTKRTAWILPTTWCLQHMLITAYAQQVCPGARKLAQWLQVLVALMEDQCSVPSNHAKQLPTTCNSNSKGSNALASVGICTCMVYIQTCRHMHIHTYK